MEKIVIVDDEPASLEILEGYLKDDYEVFAFHSSVTAIEEIPKIEPDLVLLDILMPYIDGYETLKRIRNMKSCAEIPVIGISGQKNRTAVLEFLSKGGTRYFSKPVEKHFLQGEIEGLLRQEASRKVKKKILVIDDELESLYYYKTILQKSYNVMTLNSGKMAIEYLLKFVPDLILLDYQMPLYNGRAMYQIIRKMDRIKDVPVLFLTGTQDNDVLLEIAALIPDGVILKNSGKDVLLEKVESVLNK